MQVTRKTQVTRDRTGATRSGAGGGEPGVPEGYPVVVTAEKAGAYLRNRRASLAALDRAVRDGDAAAQARALLVFRWAQERIAAVHSRQEKDSRRKEEA